MDSFKISIFENETQSKFPSFRTLSIKESNSIAKKLSLRYNLDISDFNKIQEAGQYIEDADATSEDFSINSLNLLSDQSDKIVIIWAYEYPMDVFNYTDFCNYFKYIWYPSSDDILITKESLNVLYLIRHDGIIFRIKPVSARNVRLS